MIIIKKTGMNRSMRGRQKVEFKRRVEFEARTSALSAESMELSVVGKLEKKKLRDIIFAKAQDVRLLVADGTSRSIFDLQSDL